MRPYQLFSHWIVQVLSQPTRVFTMCFLFFVLSLLWNGTLLKLYSLHKDKAQIEDNIQQAKRDIQDLEKKIAQSKDPEFIERQAIERYDWVNEGDLMFVFSE